jgi:hypothetical protein
VIPGRPAANKQAQWQYRLLTALADIESGCYAYDMHKYFCTPGGGAPQLMLTP